MPRAIRAVGLRGRLDAEGVVPVVDLVQVRRQALPLRPLVRALEREAGLLELALERALVVADVEVPDELLGDRRAALGRAARLDVLHGCPDDSPVVEAAVLEEAAVLDRDRRLRQPARHLPELERLAVLVRRDRPERGAVVGEDERVGADSERAQRVERAAGADRRRAADRGYADEAAEDEQRDEEDGPGEPTVRRPAPARAAPVEPRRELVVGAGARH